MNYIAFFSQTGSEINEVRKALNIIPALLVTNRQNLEGVNEELVRDCEDRIVYLPRKPKVEDYKKLIEEHKETFNDCVITLNGYLRIIPAFMCEQFKIYNGHPGQIIDYPELKGFNPQERAFNGGYKTAGAVIHEVSAGVDEGRILAHDEISIEGLTLDQVYSELHKVSVNLWVDFLREILKK